MYNSIDINNNKLTQPIMKTTTINTFNRGDNKYSIVKIEHSENYFTLQSLDITDENNPQRIFSLDVQKAERDDSWSKLKKGQWSINWSGCGPQTIEHTSIMQLMLEEAMLLTK